VSNLERQAEQLRTKTIPAAEQHLIGCQQEHGRMLQNATAYFEGRLKPAEIELRKLQAELKALEG
jgi:hypothetical protein